MHNMKHRRILFSVAPLLLVLISAAAFSGQPMNAQLRSSVGSITQFQLQKKTTLFATEEDESDETNTDESLKVAVKCPGCDLCDGSGRIMGGLGAIPLFSWWPIKAYRPCPNFIERGGQYVRSGQGLDEIAFGRDSTFKADK